MIGWIGDFFRFYWALSYWNVRKTWFRMRGAHRDDCPCQNYSDSGHAYDSRCEAITHWSQPVRFRRVCPLLVDTPHGWRCSVNAESVRPFWGRAFIYGGGLFLALYLAATLAVYGGLRLIHYDTSYLAIAWPPRWSELRDSQEKLYAAKAQQALQAGRYQEAMLSLERVAQLNPRNYAAGLALAGLNQVAGRAYVSDHVYERLMRDVPEQRRQTAQIWFRNLLARAAYPEIKTLAAAMLTEDPAERAAWLNALLFACRQTGDHAFLGTMRTNHPHLPDWCTELIAIEQALLEGGIDRGRGELVRIRRQPGSPYLPYFQVDRLLRHHALDQAGDVLRSYGSQLQPDQIGILRLRLYQARGWDSLVRSEFESLLGYVPAPSVVAQLCAWLLANPDPELCARFQDRFAAAARPVDASTVGLHQAAYLAAIAAGDTTHAEAVAGRITAYTGSDARVLRGLGELIRHPASDRRILRILPLVPLPTDLLYAILERAPAPPSAP